MHGKAVCMMHGGKSPVGIASASFTTGRYSKAIPPRLLDRYHAAEADPARLALDSEIALTDARLADLLGRVDTGESGALWRDLAAAYRDLEAARADKQKFAAALTAIGTLVRQ